ncbi:MAG TPA: hypothetical protein VN762_01635 [Steroidobacteraceae bacterium]|nr:hypothetical protein [Steroidobacteraceae bacterium]
MTETSEPLVCGEYSGVVEVDSPLRPSREMRQLRALLARNFDLAAEDIRILNWATLH